MASYNAVPESEQLLNKTPKTKSWKRLAGGAAAISLVLGTLVATALRSGGARPTTRLQFCKGWDGKQIEAESCWDLNGGAGPYCPDWATPARESASYQGAADRGWDPCCYYADCDIGEAVFDPAGANGKGKWCNVYDYWNNGNTCGDDFWAKGFVYDWCPCDPNVDWYECGWNDDHGTDNVQSQNEKQKCLPLEAYKFKGSEGGGWVDWKKYKGWCDKGRDVCNEGYINPPNQDGNCLSGHVSGTDKIGQALCWPDEKSF